MASRNTQKWDPKTHEDILIEIFNTLIIPNAELQRLMAGLRSKGYTFTESALRYGFCLSSCVHQSLSPLSRSVFPSHLMHFYRLPSP